MTAKQLEVDLDHLATVMDDHTGLIQHFLDTENGGVESLPEEVLSDLEDSEEEESEDGKLPEWQGEEPELARRVLADDGRFVPIPTTDSTESYRVMEEFIETVRDERLREKLAIAIEGKGAFRRFKDVLLNYPEAREEWFAFEARVKQQWARDWLESMGIVSKWAPGRPIA